MRRRRSLIQMGVVAVIFIGVCLFVSGVAYSHCDTLDGPVVKAAKVALEKGDVTPVLKWVKPENEGEVQEAFQKTLVVRTKSPEAKELADMYFFETLVRVHRAGEGAPYEGLKPAGTDLGPAVVEADKAIETGSVDSLVKKITEAVATGIRERFKEVMEKKKHQDESVSEGREFVQAYTEFIHYVERLHDAIKSHVPHHGKMEGMGMEHKH